MVPQSELFYNNQNTSWLGKALSSPNKDTTTLICHKNKLSIQEYYQKVLVLQKRTLSYPARLIKEGGCVVLSMDTLHLKYPLVLFGSGGSALTLPLFLLSPRILMLCH